MFTAAAILSIAAFAAAAPAPAKRAAITDAQILNYALTLEHLENNFYLQGLANFTSDDFCAAGTEEGFYRNLMEISKDETTHVSFLTSALTAAGAPATAACTYAFGVTDAASFLAVANVLEGVGISAYLGAAASITNPAYLTAAGSILTVESRHSAYLRNNQDPKLSPFPSAFDIPLDFDEVYSLAAQFIVSCPASNPALPVVAFPALAASPAAELKFGSKVTLTAAKSVDAKAAYFITSTGALAATLTGSGTTYTVTVPDDAQSGQGYLVLTSDASTPTDENIVAGPAVVQIQDNDFGTDSRGHWGKGGDWGNWHNGKWGKL